MAIETGVVVQGGHAESVSDSSGASDLTVWIACLVVTSLVMGVVWLAHRIVPESPPLTSGLGGYATGAAPTQVDLVPVTLPNRGCPPTPETCYAQYRFPLAQSLVTSERLAVFVPGFFGGLSIAVNGQWITPPSLREPPIRRVMFDPLLLEIPTSALLPPPATQELQVLVATPPNVFDWLAPFYVGELNDLKPAWQLAHFLAQDLLIASIGIYLILILLALLTSRIAGSDPLFLWFALLAGCAALRNLFFVWVDADFLVLMAGVYHLSTNVLAFASLAFVGTLVGQGRQQTYLWMLLLTLPILGLVFYLLAAFPQAGEQYANNATQAVVLLLTLVTMTRLVSYFGSPWSATKAWVLGCFVGAFLFTVHDVVSIGFLRENVPAQLSSLSPLLIVCAFCIVLAERLGQAFRSRQQQANRLANAVSEREQDLYLAYAQLRETERKQTLADERQRVMQDLHDGVGGQLASLVISARKSASPELVEKLEDSLADLRSVIESMDDEAIVNLGQTLHDLRERLSPWIDLQGLQHQWLGTAFASKRVVDSKWRLNMSRVMQEGITNVVRHAQASHIQVTAEVCNNRLVLILLDDGVGIADLQPASGRGLKNMARRLTALGGSMELLSPDCESARGTRLQFTVPLENVADSFSAGVN